MCVRTRLAGGADRRRAALADFVGEPIFKRVVRSSSLCEFGSLSGDFRYGPELRRPFREGGVQGVPLRYRLLL